MIAFDFKNNKRHVHFIGIGGISMSGLAEILHHNHFTVSGSDMKESKITQHLREIGIPVKIGHSKENIQGADVIIFTDAINLDNEELRGAIEAKVDLIDRASFLGMLMKNYKKSIAVSGTHGKTTTTSMISCMICNLKEDPTILLGGELDEIKGNVRFGERDLFLTEACEYKANIVKYFPTTAIILNMDEDHLDYFDNMDHIYRTFLEYAQNIPPEGHLILNIDNDYVKKLIPEVKAHVVTFSVQQEADYQAKNIRFSESGLASFDLYYHGDFIRPIHLKVMGLHNIYNALASIASVHENGLDFDLAIQGLESYGGVHRRLEYKGSKDRISVIDDYAHHPTEIQSTLHALRQAAQGKIYCVFQPHTFTRTKLLLDGFAHSFHEADSVIITDIYAAREKDYGDIHSKTLVDAINKIGDHAQYIADFDEIVDFCKKNLQPGDTLLTMGAGDVYLIGEKFLEN
ncbi:UDP-N-acetylmuramate--L-alanine ligase [Peptoniphilus sp. oral taxon 375 str. F0436]|nr:UDP-N-acetylmuramate--L-alanine ligase [Peptoniphilus sp. oral taxon 375 str. F0436]